MSSTTLPRPIARRPEFAASVRDDMPYASGGRDDAAERVNGAFDRLLLQSGLEIAPSMLLALCACAGLVFGGAAFVLKEDLLLAAFGMIAGGAVPIAWAMLARSRRRRTILHQLPEAIEELARAARTGRSLRECLEITAAESPAPLGDELRRAARRHALGLGLEAALDQLPLRTGVESTNALVCALAVHDETGGNLVAVLERTAQSVRERVAFLGRVRAATTASRATAVLMVLILPAVIAFFLYRDLTYLERLLAYEWGRTSLIAAVLLQMLGAAWVLSVLRSTDRG